MDKTLFLKIAEYYLGNFDSPGSITLDEKYEKEKKYSYWDKLFREISKVFMDIVEASAISFIKDKSKYEIEHSLNLLYKLKKEGVNRKPKPFKHRLKIFDLFIKEKFVNKWEKSGKQYVEKFKQSKKIILCSKDYFLSYTNRNAAQTNTLFEDIILDEKLDRTKNRLARKIAEKLEDRNFKGFFDLNNLTCGEEVQKEIYDACNAAICFVQLIELKSWNTASYNKNWSHLEFKFFRDKVDRESHITVNREFYILQDPIIDEDEYNIESVKDWHERVGLLKYVDKLPRKKIRKFEIEINKVTKAIKINLDKYMNQIIKQPLSK